MRFFVCVIVASFDFGFVLRCLVVCGEARPLSPRKLPTLERFRRKKTTDLPRYGVRRSRSKFSSNQFILFRPFWDRFLFLEDGSLFVREEDTIVSKATGELMLIYDRASVVRSWFVGCFRPKILQKLSCSQNMR